MSYSSSRTSRSNPEQRMSYDEIKEMMLMAAADLKRKEAREKEKAAAAAAASASSASDVLTESKAVNINGTGGGTSAALAAARITKFDRKSVSCREVGRSKQTVVDRVVGTGGYGKTAIAWNSRQPNETNWRNGHPDILEEQETSRGEVEGQAVVETPGGAGGVQQSAAASRSSSSSTSAAEGWKSDRVPQSCRTTKPTFDFTALGVHQSGSTTTVGEKVEICDNLSRTQAWLNEAEDPGSLGNAGPACNPARPFSPEIKEEDVDIISMERSALIEDQLPGRLSQSVRFIKTPPSGATGTPFLLPSTKEEKKRSSSSFRAFSSKIAAKLSRLFFSKSTNASGGPPPRFAPPPAPAPGMRNSTLTGSATTSASTTSESSTTESPTKLNTTTSSRRTSSFRKWLQKPAAGSKVASAAEPDPKPVVKKKQDEEEKARAKEGMPKAQQQQQQHKGKENVESNEQSVRRALTGGRPPRPRPRERAPKKSQAV